MDIVKRDGWINGKTQTCSIKAGETLGDFALRNFDHSIIPCLMAQINSVTIYDWKNYVPQSGEHVLIYFMPQGGSGKKALGLVAMIAISVAAPQAGAALAEIGALGLSSVGAWQGIVMVGAGLVMNAIAQNMIKPPMQAAQQDYRRDPFNMFRVQQNIVDPFGQVPRVYGKTRLFPRLVAQPIPIIEEGGDDYNYMLFDFGYGPLQIEDMKIGDSPISEYNPEIITHTRMNAETELVWFSNTKKAVDVSLELTDSFTPSKVTERDTARAVLDLHFPSGLYRVDKNSGGREPSGVDFEVEIKKDDGPYRPARYYANVELPVYGSGLVPQDYFEGKRVTGAIPGSDDPRIGYIVPFEWNNGLAGEDELFHFGIKAGTTTVQINTLVSRKYNYGERIFLFRHDRGKLSDMPRMIAGTVIYQSIEQYTLYTNPFTGVPSTITIHGLPRIELDQPLTDEDLILSTRPRNILDDIESSNPYFDNDNDGNIFTNTNDDHSDHFPIYWSHVGDRSQFTGKFRITGRVTDNFIAPLTLYFLEPGLYYIRAKRLSPTPDQYTLNLVHWFRMVSHVPTSGASFRPVVDHTVIELKVRATDQLNGIVNNFNAVATSILPIPQLDVDGSISHWVEQPTRNPAWIYLDILRGSATKYPVPESNIDFPALKDWAFHCNSAAPNEPLRSRFNCDLLIDGSTTVKEALQTVASTGHAAPARRDNKITIIRRPEAYIPVQYISPKNSSDFQATMTYISPPDALRVTYNDADLNYKPNEEIVFNDGYDESNAVVYETLELPGTTSRGQAWRLGRYFMATGILERERVICNMDVESLVAQRGDIVKVSHDVLKAGGLPRRVVSIDTPGDGYGYVTFDEPLTGAVDGFRRRKDQQETIISALKVDDDVLRMTELYAETLVVGDLIEYGVTEQIYAPFTVEKVSPGPDLSAEVQLIEYRSEVDASVNGPIPKRNMRIGANANAIIKPVQNLSIEQFKYELSGVHYFDLILRWSPPEIGHPDYYNVKLGGEIGPLRYVSHTSRTEYRFNRLPAKNYLEGALYRFGVEPVIELVGKGKMSVINQYIITDLTPPPDIEGFGLNAQSEQLILFWDLPDLLDVDHYEIRTSETPGDSWEGSTIVVPSVGATTTSISIPIQTGEYMIKSVDSVGNYSVNAARAIVQVNDIPDIEFYDTVQFEPFSDGSFISTEVNSSDDLVLDGTALSGWYIPNSATHNLTFPAPTKVRLSASMGTSYMQIANDLQDIWFQPLSTAQPLSPASAIAKNPTTADIMFRYTDGTTPIGDVPWTKLIIAVVNATEIQFLVRLATTDARFTPLVSAASVSASYDERRERGSVTIATPATESVSFAYGFAAPPMVAITLENSTVGDTFTVSNVTNSGFEVTIYDKDQNIKAGQLDWSALGYGKVF